MENRCVCCGEIIPEGRQVCPVCERPETVIVNGGVKILSCDKNQHGEQSVTTVNYCQKAEFETSNAGKFLMVNSSGNVEATTVTTKAATTYNTSTSDRTIAAGTYLTGAQTIKAVTTANIDAGNIKKDVVVTVGDANSATRIKNVTGTFTTTPSGKTALTAAALRSGYSGFINGSQVDGSMPNGAVTSGTATISSVTFADGSDAATFSMSGSANVSAPTVGTAGYISSSDGTKSAKTGGATLSATVNKIVGSASISATSKKPSITKRDVPSGVTQAASGAATTTAPSSGVYVAVKSDANTATLTPTVSITTSGYGTSTKHGISATGAAVGAAASDTTYVPITTATPAFDGGTLSGGSTATGTNVSLTTTDNGMKIQTKYTAASTAVLYNGAVNGWVSKADNAEALAAQSLAATNGTAYYVYAISVPKSSALSVAVQGDTALDTTNKLLVNLGAYRQIDLTNNANGSAVVTNSGSTTVSSGSTTAGNLTVTAYNSSGTSEADKSIVSAGKWVTPSVTGSGTYYGRVTVANGAYSASVSSHSISTTPVVNGSLTGTITNIGTTTKPSGTDGTDYWTITPSGSVGTVGKSSATAKATISTAGYIAAGDNSSGTSTINISPTVKAGSSRYIVKGAITNNTSGGTSAGTINRGSQIKIGAGYYTSDVYYTAQANSGTLTISASGSTSCNGYATVSVPSATPAFTGGGVSGTATASSTYATLSTSTNSSGVSITTNAGYTRAKVTYNGGVNGWVSKSDGDNAMDATSNTLTSTTYYLNGVQLTTPTSGTNAFSITLPNGTNDTITLRFTVYTDGNWIVE